mmetsp:Transcript_59843/g.159292  ORF Transcript_59843/g.159292 Transcript_59843/m.159292 type:complete len:281 (-) Transcript_59843:44-886(-)
MKVGSYFLQDLDGCGPRPLRRGLSRTWSLALNSGHSPSELCREGPFDMHIRLRPFQQTRRPWSVNAQNGRHRPFGEVLRREKPFASELRCQRSLPVRLRCCRSPVLHPVTLGRRSCHRLSESEAPCNNVWRCVPGRTSIRLGVAERLRPHTSPPWHQAAGNAPYLVWQRSRALARREALHHCANHCVNTLASHLHRVRALQVLQEGVSIELHECPRGASLFELDCQVQRRTSPFVLQVQRRAHGHQASDALQIVDGGSKVKCCALGAVLRVHLLPHLGNS